jgi:hypothetical protein
MKKLKPTAIYSFLLAVIVFNSCKKLPPLENLSSNFVVQTKFDTATQFSAFKTFAIRDTIAISTDNPKDSIWYDNNARSIINEVSAQMKAAGYTQLTSEEKSTADLGIQLIGIRNKIIYDVSPGYWWGLPGYADPCYWGNCNGWPYWYPYFYTYSIKTGTMIIEMADLKDAAAKRKYNIVWTGIGSGQIGDSKSFIVDQCIKSVDQAFLQSPYLKAN